MECNINKFDGRYCVFFFRIWYMGLCWILRGLKRQQQLTDRRSRWLKEKYLQLYFEDGCIEPMTADAIRAFGGRDWSTTESIGTLSPTSSSALRKRNVKGKKTKSIGNIHALTKVCSIKDLYGNERQKMKKTGELVVWKSFLAKVYQDRRSIARSTRELFACVCVRRVQILRTSFQE